MLIGPGRLRFFRSASQIWRSLYVRFFVFWAPHSEGRHMMVTGWSGMFFPSLFFPCARGCLPPRCEFLPVRTRAPRRHLPQMTEPCFLDVQEKTRCFCFPRQTLHCPTFAKVLWAASEKTIPVCFFHPAPSLLSLPLRLSSVAFAVPPTLIRFCGTGLQPCSFSLFCLPTPYQSCSILFSFAAFLEKLQGAHQKNFSEK